MGKGLSHGVEDDLLLLTPRIKGHLWLLYSRLCRNRCDNNWGGRGLGRYRWDKRGLDRYRYRWDRRGLDRYRYRWDRRGLDRYRYHWDRRNLDSDRCNRNRIDWDGSGRVGDRQGLGLRGVGRSDRDNDRRGWDRGGSDRHGLRGVRRSDRDNDRRGRNR